MLIRDNPSSRRGLRSYNYNRGKLSKTLEKLSSGCQINRSADDAAGLAVSEKMRANITGLDRAKTNSAEGISLLQVGEGALDEIHQMLNRAVFLADSSANGTYTDELDRKALQQELDQICDEIDRITRNTHFNTIQLFQDKGYDYETSKGSASSVPTIENPVQDENAVSPVETDANAVSIIYTEHASVTTTPSGNGTDGLKGLDKTITYADGSTKLLSKVLEEEIVPNTVKNVLRSYPAFSYLNGSTIGIGLEYFAESAAGGATQLAAVRIGYTVPGSDYLNYTLRVNTAALSAAPTREELQELEATIAHEMIHAFMDEATTAGMIGQGRDPSDLTGNTISVTKFPSWFVEGMAQTASGPGNWLKHMGILANSSNTDIKTAITKDKLGSGTTASEYGTGYLACMFLGAVIGNGGAFPTNSVSSETILVGLNRLLNKVISGTSLDTAIKELTQNKFSSCSDFETKFNSDSSVSTYYTAIGQFTRNLLTQTGTGRGGLISGDLRAIDLAPDTPDTTVTLFKLDPTSGTVKNVYPSGYEIYTGGAADTNGVPPTGFTEGNLNKEYGDFVVTGAADGDIQYDSGTHTLTVKAGGDIKITMKTPAASTLQDKIVVDAAATGKITLSGINTSVSDAIEIKDGANVKFELDKENNIRNIKLGNGAKVSFEGTGTLKADMFISDTTNDIAFKSGTVIIGGGTGTIIAGNVTVNNAFIGAAITASSVKNSAGADVKPISLPWNDKLSGFSGGNITSLTIDGAPCQMNIPSGQQGSLWFDPASVHRVTFTGTAGGKTVTKTLTVQNNNGTLEWTEPDIPFTVAGGTKDVDWSYDAGTNTLKILTNTELTISGGKLTEADGSTTIGRIEIANNIAADPAQSLKLNLNGIECVMKDNVSAMSLGTGNYVTLNIIDGSTNTLTSGSSHAGVAVGNDTHLTISGKTGILNATGGTYGAGIGRSGTSTTDMDASIKIEGGVIHAAGGSYGAGIGCAYASGGGAYFGNITITGGTIHAEGGQYGGAGIGGAEYAKVGDIEITDGEITAKSNGHGAGIGGGWSSSATNGTIGIHGGRITALSLQHGTGIGSGCQGTSGKITIDGSAMIVSALGGNDGAGIGASWRGTCKGIEISGSAEVMLAKGGNNGAGIGAGSSGSRALNSKIQKVDDQGNPVTDANGVPIYETIPAILIDTDKSVTAQGGESGVGIGSGYSNSAVGDISIKKGIVSAVGGTDSTGIGAGRSSTGGNITIGNPDNDSAKVIVSASGGMNYNGGNIISYTDPKHTDGNEGKLIITGKNTTVRPGEAGEGLYSTSGAVDKDGNKLYSYPLYLFEVPAGKTPLADGATLKDHNCNLPLPDDAANIRIKIDGQELQTDLTHKPLNDYHTFIWMTGAEHNLTITYDTPSSQNQEVKLSLKFYADSGTFRANGQTKPEPAKKPTYSTDPPPEPVEPDTPRPVIPSKPVPPKPEPEPEPEPVPPPQYGKGFILQIGANTGEILEIPLFYLSRESLQLNALNISTQENAWKSMPIIKDAINRISEIRGSYGAYMNRLEHNSADLSQAVEHLTEAESRIRDTDIAEEMMAYTKNNILVQSAQAMLAQANQVPQNVLQLFQ